MFLVTESVTESIVLCGRWEPILQEDFILNKMYDSIFLRLQQSEANGASFLEETPCYLERVSEHLYGEWPVITGNLNGLKVAATRNHIDVKDGSLCKFYLGDNFQTLGRRDTQRAVEMLSDLLHLQMDKANVTRMDVAQNFIMLYPPDVYYNHLGQLRYAKRLTEPDGLYYKLGGGRICFYDKLREQKSNHEEIPELYQNRNVLRYERRFQQRIPKKFDVGAVKACHLYDESFYKKVIDRWRSDYRAIGKVNDVTINIQAMKTKQQLYKMGVLSLVKMCGGQNVLIGQINESLKRGDITKKQAYDLRLAVNDACQIRDGLMIPNDAIQELTKKVDEAARFYR